jgi:HAT1-interacting factor 1
LNSLYIAMTDNENNSVKRQEKEKSTPLPTFSNDEIDQLVAKGLESYAVRNYEDATEKLGLACGRYSEINGKEDPRLLFIYGRALFKVAMASSEVLGEGNVNKSEETDQSGMFQFEGSVGPEDAKVENGDGKGGEGERNGERIDLNEEADGELSDDENDDQNDDGNNEDEANEEQTDFEVAWEILDLARTLFIEELTKLEDPSELGDPSTINDLRKKLAETYDILGEVSLESENFPQACEDFNSGLALKQKMYPLESTLISEAHYKLALAYEFNFEDKDSRAKSIEHMEKTIHSVKLRIEKSGEDDPDLVADLELRLKELQEIDEASASGDKSAVLQGILGGDATTAKAQILSAVSQASDISTLVRKAPKRKADSLNE